MDVKKMLAVGAAVIGTVAMADGIVSSSVVGYQNVTNTASQKCFNGSTFYKITEGKLTLGEIGVDAKFSSGSDTLTILDQWGGIKKMCYYVDQANIDIMKDYFVDKTKAVVGWYDADLYDNWDWESDLPNANAVAVPSASGFMLQVSTNKGGVIIPSAL